MLLGMTEGSPLGAISTVVAFALLHPSQVVQPIYTRDANPFGMSTVTILAPSSRRSVGR